ncbi:MAG TPA: von Willebrand factor type A domain-containing protein [Agriterribacter sp.]|nr:von Willebrand factor type A domain-containing protein [Agriterribacter sp.]
MKYETLYGIIIIAVFTAFLPRTTFTVKGNVTDNNGAALSAVSITEKGTGNMTQTDSHGDFAITIAHSAVTLVFSSPGYDIKEIKVSGHAVLKVQLSPARVALDEVVVTGYAGTKKKSLTGAIHREAKGDMVLQGSVAGVMVRGNSTLPAGATRKASNSNQNLYGSRDQDFNTEDYDGITENRFLTVTDNPLSTFSIDVDAASYSNVRRFLNDGQLPPAGAVRIEEMINYFHYDYPQPKDDIPFSIYTELSVSPWNNDHRLVLVSLQGKKIETQNIPVSNLVFLIDVSGSMQDENKLPLVKQSMKLLADQLREQDKVAIVVYAGNAGMVLPATSGLNSQTIRDAIDRLEAGGSTAGGAGIKLAYQIAKQNFVQGGNNRVILCTDGDFNVGASSDDDMERLIEQERSSGVFLTVLGYGMGNYKDSKMQKLADKGNGNHAYIDNIQEAKKVLVSEFGGTLFTIAKDVKLQVEFNPVKVQAYRLVGYENRILNKEDFNNDKKDAGELGSGHTVTAFYEIIPAGVKSEFVEYVDPLKYQALPTQRTNSDVAAELMTIKFRYKKPDETKSRLIVHPVTDKHILLKDASDNFRFAAAVAEFGMLLRQSEFRQRATYNNVLALAGSAIGKDAEGYRKEFLGLVQKAGSVAKTVDQDSGGEKLMGKR